MAATHGIDGTTRQTAIRRGKVLENFTIAWNSLEGLIAVTAGVFAGSISLVGFGFDSVMKDESAERRARQVVGVFFFVLAAYVMFDSVKSLVAKERPEESTVGIVLAALSVVVMPFIAMQERRVAAVLNSGAMRADSQQTQLCAYLFAILLLSLIANAALGVLVARMLKTRRAETRRKQYKELAADEDIRRSARQHDQFISSALCWGCLDRLNLHIASVDVSGHGGALTCELVNGCLVAVECIHLFPH